MNDTPEATERSEGGSDNTQPRPKYSGLYPIVLSLRLSERMREELTIFRKERRWSENEAIRALIERGLASYSQHLTLDHEPPA